MSDWTRTMPGMAAVPVARSRLNAKDIISGALLMGFAVLGYWFNQDHALGSARRMGPGYMPMMTFYILGVLGFLVLVIGFRNGPDPLARWTGIDIGTAALAPAAALAVIMVGPALVPALQQNQLFGLACLAGMLVLALSKGWRLLAWVLIAMALFGLLLETLGLMAVVALTVVASALADETQTPLGVLSCAVFLCLLTYGVFIYGLDIRVPVWPQL